MKKKDILIKDLYDKLQKYIELEKINECDISILEDYGDDSDDKILIFQKDEYEDGMGVNDEFEGCSIESVDDEALGKMLRKSSRGFTFSKEMSLEQFAENFKIKKTFKNKP